MPLAALVNYACHAVCLSGKYRLISADFPGAMRQVVESVTGATTLYLQGATGNMNPVLMGDDYRNPRSTGVKLAAEALKVWESIVPTQAHGLAVASERVPLPSLRFLSKEHATAALEATRKELAQLQKGKPEPGHVRWVQRRIQRAEAAIRSWETGEPLPTISDRIHAVRFGEVALVASAGEIFTQIGVEIKRRSPLPNTLFAGYTNGDIGYIPTPDAYPEGGYEVERACRVDPQTAETLTEGCLRVLGRVKG
jgi:hypothetical protein